MDKVTKEKIEQLKAKHPEGVYEAEIRFSDEVDKLHVVEFIHRKPVVADMDAFLKSSSKSLFTASLNLIQSLVIDPEPGPIIDQLRDYPMAYSNFVNEVITPFFGQVPASRSLKK